MTTFIMVQIVGLLVFLVNAINALQQKRKNILIYNGLVNLLCALQYLLLGAYTGIICCLIAFLRNIIFSKYKRKVPFHIYIIFAIILIIVNSFFIKNVIDIIPVINVLLFSYSITQSNIGKIKKILIITGILGMTYDATQGAYAGILLNLTDFMGGVIGVMKYNKKKKR